MKKINFVCLAILLLIAPLAAASVMVVSPNGGEQWALNTPQNIIWTSTNAGNLKVDIVLRNGSGKVGVIKSQVLLAAGSWPWTTGKLEDGTMAAAGPGYIIRIRDAGNAFSDDSNNPFAIAPAAPVIVKVPEHRLPPPFPFGSPKLAVTTINLVRNASGYSIVFGYKNVGNAALPKRHELTVKPDYRVLIDGREIDKGDLFFPESPPAGPGWEMATQSGGSINFPVNEPRPWYIGKQITVILNERNALNMGSASKTSSLLPIVLTVGYDLAFGPITFDWNTCKAHVMITKVGVNPQLSKKFILRYTIRGYHPAEHIEHDPTEATVTTSAGPFTSYANEVIIPVSSPFPVRLDLPICGAYSTFYELQYVLSSEGRDEFDERNNTSPQVRYNRPEVPRGPRILSIGFGQAQNAQGKDVLRTWVTLKNKDARSYGGMRLVLKRNDSLLQEWPGVTIGPEQEVFFTNDSKWDPMAGNIFTAYLYDSSGKILYDAKSQYR